MTRSLATLLAVLAATAAGCGASTAASQDFSGAEQDVAEVVEDLQNAAQEDEPTKICTEILSTELSQRLGNRCTDVVQSALDDADVFEVTADSVRISGDRARVRVDAGSDDEQQETLEMVRQRGDGWRIDRFGAVIR